MKGTRWFVQRFNGKPLVTRISGGNAQATADGKVWRDAPGQMGLVNAGEPTAQEVASESEAVAVFRQELAGGQQMTAGG